MENAPARVLISHIDFAENYTFAIQNEVQSIHWFSTGISILVHITLLREESEMVRCLNKHITIFLTTKSMTLFLFSIA
jgi:hypothetical protein